MAGRRHRSPGLVLRLALADLRHEWILAICLMLAIAAVITPLLLLFGLKYGTIETLRVRLMQDPKNREIRPLTSRSFERPWFVEIRALPDVAFVIPQTRQIAATVGAQVKGRDVKSDLDLIPTGAGDALISENGAPNPGAKEAVLSSLAAEAIGAKTGDTLIVTANRLRGSAVERATVEIRVAGVLNLRAGAIKTLYVPLELLEAVERFKDGMAVPELGWPGTAPRAFPQYPGVLLAAATPLPPTDQYALCNNTGFTRISELHPTQLVAKAGFEADTNRTWYLLETLTRPGGEDNVRAVRDRMRGRDVEVLPWFPAILGTLSASNAPEPVAVRVFALPMEAAAARKAGVKPEPAWPTLKADSGRDLLRLLPPAGFAGTGIGELTVSNGPGVLRLPVALETNPAPAGAAFAPHVLAGVLTLARQRELLFEPAAGELLLQRRGYAGFRLYAKTIDDVDTLRRRFEAEGIPVHTEAEKIRSVKELDRYLTILFWLIAAVGIAGSAASLLASLYASVERKKRDLGVLRLLGLTGGALARFPIYQGAGLAGGGCGMALLFFTGTAWTINTLFKSHLQAGESFCRLPPEYMVGALVGAVALASFAAMAAVGRLSRIEPAEALRDE